MAPRFFRRARTLLSGSAFTLSALLHASTTDETIQERERQAAHRAYAARVSELTSRLERYIADELVKKAGQDEYPPARHYAMHDLDGDHMDDLLLITRFGLLSGGNYEQSELLVALTTQPNKVQRLIVGGRGQRTGEQFSKDEGHRSVFLTFKVWAKTDALCCPSLTRTAEIRSTAGKVEVVELDAIRRGN